MRALEIGVVICASLCACVTDDLVDCGDGRACPTGTVCAILAQNAELRCSSRTELAACDGVDPFGSCMLRGGDVGACYESGAGGVCLPTGCGNGLVDPAEACDDGNSNVGDGCSAGCRSAETCGNGVVDPVTAIGSELCDDSNAVGHDGCTSTCGTEAPVWERLEIGRPDGVHSAGIAFDSARGRIVMFGGGVQNASFFELSHNETWESDGDTWVHVPATVAPSPRSGVAMTYDPHRRRVVLFGGFTSSAVLGDTWEWDGTAWVAADSAAKPPPRAFATLAYDPRRKRVVLFGGSDSDSATEVRGDAWEWDGATWTQLAGPLPTARTLHAMAFDPARGAMVIAGGRDADETPVADTWEDAGAGWVRSTATTPVALVGSSLAFDGTGLIAFGGRDTQSTVDTTWRWNGQIWQTLSLAESPPPRNRAALVANPSGGRVLLFGGHWRVYACLACAMTLSDQYQWDGARWILSKVPSQPAAREQHATAWDSVRHQLVVFGGASTSYLADTWILDGTSWSSILAGPPARVDAAMAYDSNRQEVILFGGRSATDFGDTWRLVNATWTRVSTTGPSPRSDHAMAFDPVRNRVVLFGGGTTLSDTWEWDGTSWMQRTPTTSPPGRYGHALAWDPIRRRVRMFGGDLMAGSTDEVWEWDGVTWTNVSPPYGWPARSSFGAVWNATRRTFVLAGGGSSSVSQFDDTWELTTTGWHQVYTVTPGHRRGQSLVPLADGTGALMFAGLDATSTVTDDLWQLRWQGSDAYEQCSAGADTDGDGLTGCADPDCWSRCTPQCPPGATCEPSWPRCGDGVCDASFESCRLCPGDCSCTPICGDHVCDAGESCIGDCL